MTIARITINRRLMSEAQADTIHLSLLEYEKSLQHNSSAEGADERRIALALCAEIKGYIRMAKANTSTAGDDAAIHAVNLAQEEWIVTINGHKLSAAQAELVWTAAREGILKRYAAERVKGIEPSS